jgi:hypothetical protein
VRYRALQAVNKCTALAQKTRFSRQKLDGFSCPIGPLAPRSQNMKTCLRKRRRAFFPFKLALPTCRTFAVTYSDMQSLRSFGRLHRELRPHRSMVRRGVRATCDHVEFGLLALRDDTQPLNPATFGCRWRTRIRPVWRGGWPLGVVFGGWRRSGFEVA